MFIKPTRFSKLRLLHPDYIAKSVCDIDFSILKAKGIKVILIDLDGTVVSRGTFNVDKKITAHLKKQTIDIYIATNRPKNRSLKDLKVSLHAKGVIHPSGIFMKPLPLYYRQAAVSHKFKTAEVAMIGDRYLQDIFGANLAGYTTILVRKLGQPQGFLDTMLSHLEHNRTNKLMSKYINSDLTTRPHSHSKTLQH